MKKQKNKMESKKLNYLLYIPSISIVISNKGNLKYYSNFSNVKQLPFNLRLFFNSIDGLRPLHNVELLNDIENKILPLNKHTVIPASDYFVTINENEILTENDIIKFLEYKTGKQEENTTPLKEIEADQRKVIDGRVSVIIPTYKRPVNLKNALESVVMQDYHDIEVIIICDNGKDSKFNKETRQIVNSLKDSNLNCKVVLLEHNLNRNGAAARNTGIMNSTGEYICFLDDDDIYLEGRLSKSIKRLKKTQGTADAIYCGYLGWNSQKNNLSRYKTGDLTLEILLLDYKKHYLHTNTATYKRESILTLNGFDESYYRYQDLELNLRFFEHFKIEVLKECLIQLKPEPTDVDNGIYNFDVFNLKQKFLNQFSYIIQTYDETLRKSIYEAHWTNVKDSIIDKDKFINKIIKNPKERFLCTLISTEKAKQIKSNLYTILDTINQLVHTSGKTEPIKKYKAYKEMLKTYYEIRRVLK